MMFLLRFLLIFLFVTKIFALAVSPTRINLSEAEPIGTLVVTNDSTEGSVLQLSLVKWTQTNEKDFEIPSSDLLVTPPIFSLAPYKSQLIRIGMERPLSQRQDQAYRLIIAEVAPSFRKTRHDGINFLLRLSLPVVIETMAPRISNTQWLVKKSSGLTYLTAVNTGNTIEFISSIAAISKQSELIVKPFKSFCYLLPGSKKTWALDIRSNKTISAIEANIDNNMVVSNVG